MKCYNIKDNDYIIGWVKTEDGHFDPKLLKKNLYNGYLIDYLPDFKNQFIKSKEELIKSLINCLHDYDITNDSFINYVINTIEIDEYEVNYEDIPCIIVKCEPLEDQYECDASRIPTLYLNSMKELETLNIDYPYEVWKIKDGKILYCEEYSTYI